MNTTSQTDPKSNQPDETDYIQKYKLLSEQGPHSIKMYFLRIISGVIIGAILFFIFKAQWTLIVTIGWIIIAVGIQGFLVYKYDKCPKCANSIPLGYGWSKVTNCVHCGVALRKK